MNEVEFWRSVERQTSCWVWKGGQSAGFGICNFNGKTVSHNAHRAAYRLFIGEPPINTEIDHLCHGQANCQEGRKCIHRRCVNPAHLEAVTRGTNWSRSNNNSKKTHCPQGHEYSSSNTTFSKGRRHCKTCSRRRK